MGGMKTGQSHSLETVPLISALGKLLLLPGLTANTTAVGGAGDGGDPIVLSHFYQFPSLKIVGISHILKAVFYNQRTCTDKESLKKRVIQTKSPVSKPTTLTYHLVSVTSVAKDGIHNLRRWLLYQGPDFLMCKNEGIQGTSRVSNISYNFTVMNKIHRMFYLFQYTKMTK